MAIEVGKTRLEALGDVEESADLIRYYTHQLAEADGFVAPMQRLSPNEETIDVMRPYGVWTVISPFNFPMALVAGPVGAALAAGNTVVSKPSEIGALCGLKVLELFHEAGVPAGALNVLTGPGEQVGAALVAHRGVDGVTFTGSVEVGMGIYRGFASAYPKPVVCEMGGRTRSSSARPPTSTPPSRARRGRRTGWPGRSAPPRRARTWTSGSQTSSSSASPSARGRSSWATRPGRSRSSGR